MSLVNLFVTKEKFFKNSKRVVVLTEKTLLSYEGDVVKLKLAYREIQAVGPGSKPTQFQMKTPQMVENYITDSQTKKEISLTFLHDFRKKVCRKGEENNLELLQIKSFTEELLSTTVIISNVSISKLDGDRAFSSKFIKDVQCITVIEEEDDGFVILFSDHSKTYYRIQGGVVSSVVDFVKKLLLKYYGRPLTISKAKRDEILPQPIELLPNERLFGFPIKKFSKRLGTTENRSLCLTATHLYICDGATVLSSHPIESLQSVSIFEDDPNKFEISYENSTKFRPSLFFCDERDTIISNLMFICGSESQGPEFDLSGTHRAYFIPLSCRPLPDFDSEEYYLKKLLKLKLNKPEAADILKEFLTNIPASYSMQVKDRRVISHLFEMIPYLSQQCESGNTQPTAILIDILSVVQRLLGSRAMFSDIRGVKDAPIIFSDLLRSRHDIIVAAACMTIRSIIELPKAFAAKEIKFEALNKNTFLSTDDKVSPILNALLSTLIQRAGESISDETKNHTLAISCLLDILVSKLDSHSATTDKAWFKEVTPKLSRGRVLITLFELARSSCLAIALKTTIIIKVILTQIPQEQYPSIQDSARQQLSLLYQILQAVDSRIDVQRMESAELVGLMAENNVESMRLIFRMFPKGIIRALDVPLDKKVSKRDRLLRTTDVSRTKLNWNNLFRTISKDYRTPSALWNGDTRNEVVRAISEEIDRYQHDKENNQETNKIWNHEEFSVEYETLDKELIILDTYIGIILEQPDQLELSEPATYLYQCFHKLIMEQVPENQIRYLNVMSWCYRKYTEKIGVVTCYPNLIQLLGSFIASEGSSVAGALLEFILSSFKDKRNVRVFISLGGVSTASNILRKTHCPDTSAESIVALNVLLTASRHVKSTDERGCIKIPIPRSKRELSAGSALTHLAWTLVSSSDLVIDCTARLLAEVLDKNGGKVKMLHKHTGILYFIFAYKNTSAGPSLMRLLQILAPQQDPHLLRKFIPDTVASYLMTVDADDFANVFYCSTSSPEVIWTPSMLEILQTAVTGHIQHFVDALAQDPYSAYSFQDMENIEYPGLDQELRCGNYYVRNIIENPEWNIENVEEVLRDALQQTSVTAERSEKVLLIRACATLFKKKRYRRKETIKNFEGFPLVLSLVDLDRQNPDLSGDNIELLTACCELILYSVWTSDHNLTNFLKLKGLSRLCNLLWCCSRNVQVSYTIIVFVLKIVCRLLPSPITRDQVALNTDIIRDILSCLTVGQPFDIVSLAMQSVIEFSQEPRLAEALFKNGGHFYLLDFVLSFNPTPGLPTDEEKLNQLSVSACLVLGNISGIYKPQHELLNATEEKLQSALTTLLTKGNLDRMRSESEFLFVSGLSQAIESPVSIWNESTRNELAHFIRSRIQAHQHTQQIEADELNFSFEAHKAELQVDSIFLRYYIENPNWRLNNSRSFVSKLLAEIPNYRSDPGNLAVILQSLYFVLTETQGLEKLIVSNDALDEFFSVLSSSDQTLQSLILSIFLHATANQSCVDAICASDRLPQFVSFLQVGALDQRRILLEVISNMVSCSARAVEGITTSGLILYLISYVVESKDEQLRAQSLGVLKQTKSSSGLDTKFIDAANLFFPPYLVALLDRPANFLHMYDQDTSSPNLIWNDTNRASCRHAASSTLSSFQASSSKEWSAAGIAPIDYSAVNGELSLGGVYVDLYLTHPQARLHNPALFIDECCNYLVTATDPTMQSKLISCLSQLLTCFSAWAHHIAQKPPQLLQSFLSYLASPSLDENVKGCVVKIIVILVHVPSCRKKFHQTAIADQLLTAAESIPLFEELAMRTMYLLVKKETSFIKQLLDAQKLPFILSVLDKRIEASKFAMAVIKSMVVDRKYDAQVRHLLSGREQILSDRSKLPQPEWVGVGKFTPAVKALFFEPMDASARAQQVASLQRQSSSIATVQVTAPSHSTPAPSIAPVSRPQMQAAPAPRTPTVAAPVVTPVATPVAAPVSAPVTQRPGAPAPPAKPTSISAPAASTVHVPPPPIGGAPPPPPPAESATLPRPPAGGAGRGALLSSIVAGRTLKKVTIPTEEEKQAQRASAPSSSGGGGGSLMNALAGALAARRTAMVTDLAANPFDDEQDEESEEWE